MSCVLRFSIVSITRDAAAALAASAAAATNATMKGFGTVAWAHFFWTDSGEDRHSAGRLPDVSHAHKYLQCLCSCCIQHAI